MQVKTFKNIFTSFNFQRFQNKSIKKKKVNLASYTK